MSLVVFEVKGSLRVFQDDAKVKCKVFSDKYPLRLYIVAPRFLVLLRDMSLVVFEVKGSLRVFQDDAKVKCKVFSDKYPLRLYIVAPRPKKAGAGWECLSYTDEKPPINLNQQ